MVYGQGRDKILAANRRELFMPASSSRHRFLKWTVLALGAMALLLGGALLSGAPQPMAARWAIARFSGAEVELPALSLRPGVHIPSLTLRDSGTEPFVTLSDLRIAYRWRPEAGRWVDDLSLDSVAVRAEERDDGGRNFGFMQRLLAQPSSGIDPTPFLPRNVTVRSIDLDARMPTWAARMGGLGVTASIPSLRDFTVTMAGQPLSFSWALGGPEAARRELSGAMKVVVNRNPEGHFHAEAHVALPELAEVDGVVSVKSADGSTDIEADVPKAAFHTPMWSEMLSEFLPAPIRFEALDVDQLHTQQRWAGTTLETAQARGNAAIKDLVVGPPDAPWYTGPLRVALDGGTGTSNRMEAALELNHGQKLDVTLSGNAQEATVTGTIKKWSRADLIALVPAAYRAYLEPLSEVQVAGAINATLRQDEPYRLKISVQLPRLVYAGVSLPKDTPLTIAGDVRMPADFARVEGDKFEVSCGEHVRVTVKKWNKTLRPFGLAGNLDGMADLEWLGALAGLDNLYGEASFQGPVRVDASGAHASIESTADTLGYGDWALPYGTPLILSAELQAANTGAEIQVNKVKAALGDGTSLSAEQLTIKRLEKLPQDGARGRAPSQGTTVASDLVAWRVKVPSLILRTDLAPAVAMGYLAAAEGTAELRAADLSWQPEHDSGRAELTLNAATLTLPGEMAVLANVQASGVLEDLAALTGHAEVSADELTVVRATLRKFSAKLVLGQEVATIEIPDSTLFDGTVNARAEIRLREPNLPFRVSGTLRNVDLAVFTREVKPPAVQLAGRASGEFEAVGDLEGVQSLDANLRCDEGFAINRDVVQRLALYTQGIVLIGKSLERAIGQQDPRPFDRAELTLGYAAGNSTVSVFVSSRLLDLAPVFYIKADLLDLLRLMKEDQFQNISGLDYSTP
jgi:hypothetical protein